MKCWRASASLIKDPTCLKTEGAIDSSRACSILELLAKKEVALGQEEEQDCLLLVSMDSGEPGEPMQELLVLEEGSLFNFWNGR